MKKGKPLVWILDDEWENHEIEKAIYAKEGYEVKVTKSDSFSADILEYAPYADGVVAQVGFTCNGDVINQMTSCKVIAISGVGFNHVDLTAAKAMGILVANIPDYCLDEVSDHTMALLLSITRRFRMFNEKVKEGVWDPLGVPTIHRLNTQTVGLLGFGRISRMVSKKLKPFGVRILTHDPYVDEAVFKEFDIESVTLDELFSQSNILSLHTPLTEETKNLVQYEGLMQMPKGAFIINTSRGAVINEKGLIRAIEEGHIAGAALDVLVQEPPQGNNPLIHMEKVFVTPHSAYNSIEALVELKERTCQTIIDGIKKGALSYTI